MKGATGATLLALFACGPAPTTSPQPRDDLTALEQRYQRARYWDDQERLLQSRGTDSSVQGVSHAVIHESLTVARADLGRLLRAAPISDPRNQAAFDAIRTAWDQGLSGDSAAAEAGGDAMPLARLTDSMMKIYGAATGGIVVDADTLDRLAILGLLARTDDRDRRERLFRALVPVWHSINGDDGPTSPYRRLLALRRSAWGDSASPIERKAPAFGLTTPELERWLVDALGRWRASLPDTLYEPWDWYYLMGFASRRLSPRVPAPDDIRRVDEAYYRSLGADPVRLGVHYDLIARTGKYPVAFTDFGVRNRWRDGQLVPGEPWVFASYLEGGLDNLAELVHETGHAIHIAAIDTRPAFIDWPDNDTFTEALADLPAMEVYEPAWQARFLGDSAPLGQSLRAKYAGIVFDMAWALFEIRVHRDPGADPNLVWITITRDFLRIRPHPELSWWAMRGQLVDSPGYLINYALGAFIVADLRQSVRRVRGPSAWSDPGLYAWLSNHLYRFGLERPSREVLEQFLGRPLQAAPLLDDLARIAR